MRQITFVIPRLPPSLNVLLRSHWRDRCALQKAFDDQIFGAWCHAGRCVFTVPVNLTYVLSFLNKNRRDIDNYIGGTKLLTDALRRTFLFRDDSEWIRSIKVKFIKGAIEGTVVIIEEDQGDQRGQ